MKVATAPVQAIMAMAIATLTKPPRRSPKAMATYVPRPPALGQVAESSDMHCSRPA
ncbi:hypothetical protein D3C81_970700 [compost metagenome]